MHVLRTVCYKNKNVTSLKRRTELLDCIDICKLELDDLNDMVDELETDDGEDGAFQDGRAKAFTVLFLLTATALALFQHITT